MGVSGRAISGMRRAKQEMSEARLNKRIKDLRSELRTRKAAGRLGAEWTAQTAQEAVELFMQGHRHGLLFLEAADLLTDLATLDDPELAKPATSAYFSGLIERLADTFQRSDLLAQQAVLARTIMRVRALPQTQGFHDRLTAFGLNTEEDMGQRVRQQRLPKRLDHTGALRVRKVLLFSRVTIGADIALTSLAIEKMRRRFPQAEIVLFGDRELEQLFGGDPQIGIRQLRYARHGELVERFLAWPEAAEAVRRETQGLGRDDQWFIVNLNSRISQSGLLPFMPVAEEAQRHFFWDGTVADDVLAQGTAISSQGEDLQQWLETVFGPDPENRPLYPTLHLRPQDDAFGEEVFRRLRLDGRPLVVAINLGVGGNQDKRIWDGTESERIASPFERELIPCLLAEGATVILDKGLGWEEETQANELVRGLEVPTVEVLRLVDGRIVTIPGQGERRYEDRRSQSISADHLRDVTHVHVTFRDREGNILASWEEVNRNTETGQLATVREFLEDQRRKSRKIEWRVEHFFMHENFDQLAQVLFEAFRQTPQAVVSFQGPIGKLGSLVTRSHLYVGYDSQGHHLAAALGRDVVAVFAGYPLPLFADRWKPTGPRTIKLVRAGNGPFNPEQQAELVGQVLAAYRQLRPPMGADPTKRAPSGEEPRGVSCLDVVRGDRPPLFSP
ncbi:MAG: glycosyltransferase family 9 protein [Nitrospinota bacterium]